MILGRSVSLNAVEKGDFAIWLVNGKHLGTALFSWTLGISTAIRDEVLNVSKMSRSCRNTRAVPDVC